MKVITPELTGALRATVMIQANGARKGAAAKTWPVLRAAPGLQDIWQLHTLVNPGKDANPPDDFAVNTEASAGLKWHRISAAKSGQLTVAALTTTPPAA